MFPWRDAPNAGTVDSGRHEAQPVAYVVGQPIYSGDSRGTVVSVDAAAGTLEIVWDDSSDGGRIIYPLDASYLRGPLPWETT